MKFEFSRKYLFFLFLTIASLWFGGYVQREINSFRTVEPEDLFDFRVYYLAGQVSHSDTDRHLYSYKEIPDPNGESKLKIVNPQMQPFTPGTTYAEFASPINPGIGQYIYPPFFATTVVPLTFLPYEKAKIVWHIMTLLFAALGIIITVRFFSNDYLTILLISLAGIILMEFTAPMRDLLMVCNIGSLILLLITAGIWLHKKYPSAAALLFALAVFIKLTPIVVVPLMIIRKQWKWLAWFGIWSVLILLFSFWQLSWVNHQEFFLRLMPAMSEGIPVSGNRSISALFYALIQGRFLTAQEIEAVSWTQGAIIPNILFKITAGVSFISLLVFFWYRRSRNLIIEVFVLILWSIVFAPVSFRHYYILSLSAIIFAWLHPQTRENSSVGNLALLTVATVMIYSLLPNYIFAVSNSLTLQLTAFLTMPLGVLLLGRYLLNLLKLEELEPIPSADFSYIPRLENV